MLSCSRLKLQFLIGPLSVEVISLSNCELRCLFRQTMLSISCFWRSQLIGGAMFLLFGYCKETVPLCSAVKLVSLYISTEKQSLLYFKGWQAKAMSSSGNVYLLCSIKGDLQTWWKAVYSIYMTSEKWTYFILYSLFTSIQKLYPPFNEIIMLMLTLLIQLHRDFCLCWLLWRVCVIVSTLLRWCKGIK